MEERVTQAIKTGFLKLRREGLTFLAIAATALILFITYRWQILADINAISGVRYAPNFDELIKSTDLGYNNFALWLLVIGTIFFLSKFLGLSYLTAGVIVSLAAVIPHLNFPVIRLLNLESSLATTAACGLSLLAIVRISKAIFKEECSAGVKNLKKVFTFLIVGIGGLLLYSQYNELSQETIFQIIRVALVVIVICLVAFMLLRQATNFIRLFGAIAICFIASFSLLPGVFESSQRYDYESLLERGESSIDVIVMAFREEHFNLTDFLDNLQTEFGAVDLSKIDLQLLEQNESLPDWSQLKQKSGLPFGKLKALIMSEQVLQKALNSKVVNIEDGRAQPNHSFFSSTIAVGQGGKNNLPDQTQKDTIKQLSDIRANFDQDLEILVMDRRGQVYRLLEEVRSNR